jgi:uncharacterized HAD superfamily protein
MSRRLKVGVDMDGVIDDFVSAFRYEAQRVLGRAFPLFSSDWDFSNWNMTAEEQGKVWDRIRETENWFLWREGPFSGSINPLLNLSKSYELYFITTRVQTQGLSVQTQTQYRLSNLGVEFPTVVVIKDKGPVSAALQLDAFIDDRIENLQRIQECSPSTKIYLMDQTYNENFREPESWTRVRSLREFYEVIKNAAVAD